MSARKPRLRDVAAAAGTSTKTASRVINGDPRVADDTRARVESAIASLGYRVDVAARSLRRGIDDVIAVIVPTIGDPFMAAVIEEIERIAIMRGVRLLVASNARDAEIEREVVESLLARRVAGLIIVPNLADYSFMANLETPVVFLDRHPDGLAAPAVVVDDTAAAKLATEHLIAYGHQRVAALVDDVRIQTSRLRLDGYRAALTAAHLPFDADLVATDCVTARDAEEWTDRLLDLDRPPTAVFSSRSEITLGVVRALSRAGRPDIALVSFGDFRNADLLDPPVSAIDHDPRELAQQATERLFRSMDGHPPVDSDTVIDLRLIARGSGERAPASATRGAVA